MNTNLIRAAALAAAAALTLAALACGSDDPTATPVPDPTATPTSAPSDDGGAPAPTPTSTPMPAPTSTPTPAPEADDDHSDDGDSDHGHDHSGHDHGDLAPTATPTPTPTPDPDANFERGTGDVDGVVFVVSEGSEATFSVDEELANVSIPDYEAVMRTTGISGEIYLDGGASALALDLHSMTSDDSFRDRYVQNRMFPDQREATISFGDLTPLPAGFTDGEEVAAEIVGTLGINGVDVPLTFAVQARDDGDVVYVLGRSSFTWDEINEPVPDARVIVSLGDEVRVEVLLALTPQPAG